ncbi:hypothetical protein A2866_02485, partial [Candidatus Roizmanbacteria bacterium RIFCSPHIGHO2_01_FULL_39_8]
FLIYIPALSMRIVAEEKRTNTLEVLLTLPLSETQVILAKFLALVTIVGVSLTLTLGLPVSLSFLSGLYLPEIVAGYFGSLLLTSFYISLSMFFSSQTKNQVVAFLLSILALFLFTVISTDVTASILPRSIQDFLVIFSPMNHLLNFIKGVIEVRSLFYFISGTLVFLFLAVIDLEKRE